MVEELTEAAIARNREVGNQAGAGEPPWWLLHGLISIGLPALQSRARRAVGRVTKELRGDAAVCQQPDWLGKLGWVTATGEVWEIRDAYGRRIALIVGFVEVSPYRVEFQLALINGWIPDDPITRGEALLPAWVRWHGEQAGLPEHLIDRGVAAAAGCVRAAPGCAGHRV